MPVKNSNIPYNVGQNWKAYNVPVNVASATNSGAASAAILPGAVIRADFATIIVGDDIKITPPLGFRVRDLMVKAKVAAGTNTGALAIRKDTTVLAELGCATAGGINRATTLPATEADITFTPSNNIVLSATKASVNGGSVWIALDVI